MSNERFYTVTPFDFDDEAFTQEGLQATLNRAHALWGGKNHKAAAASVALSLGGGMALLATQRGRVTLERDEAARVMAQARAAVAAAEQRPDGRTRPYAAHMAVVRVLGPTKAETTWEGEIKGKGLMGLLCVAALQVEETLGDIPECMSRRTCEQRERSLRAQLGCAKTQGRNCARIHFPPSDVANFFEVEGRPNEYYRVVLSVKASGPEELTERGEGV